MDYRRSLPFLRREAVLAQRALHRVLAVKTICRVAIDGVLRLHRLQAQAVFVLQKRAAGEDQPVPANEVHLLRHVPAEHQHLHMLLPLSDGKLLGGQIVRACDSAALARKDELAPHAPGHKEHIHALAVPLNARDRLSGRLHKLYAVQVHVEG